MEKSVKHRGVMLVDPEDLARYLRLPVGTRIVGARLDNFVSDTIELAVEHPDLPEVRFGEVAPVVTPTARWLS